MIDRMKCLKPILLLAAVLFAAACTKDTLPDEIAQSGVYGSPMNDGAKGRNPFYDFCLKNFDFNKDGLITIEELGRVTVLDCSSQGLASLDGLQYFSSLDTLRCSNNKLKELDLSNNKKLRFLDCSNNYLEKLDVSATIISTLYCSPMNDEKGNNLLKYLFIYRGQSIEGVTYAKDAFKEKRIPDETKIVSVPSSKDGDTDTD